MFSYYGSKANIVHLYPKPIYDDITDHFCGSGKYPLLYFEKNVTLIDKYEVIARVWKFLQLCSPGDILKLAIPGPGKTTNDCVYDCIEAKWLVGFIIHYGSFSPGTKMSAHYYRDRTNGVNYTLKRIAGDLFKIKHWTILQGSYEDFPVKECTHFVDPPYQEGGKSYVESSKNIDFKKLGEWCQQLPVQAIVCEKITADWLPFKPLSIQFTSRGVQKEGIWTNLPSAFDNEQIKLL